MIYIALLGILVALIGLVTFDLSTIAIGLFMLCGGMIIRLNDEENKDASSNLSASKRTTFDKLGLSFSKWTAKKEIKSYLSDLEIVDDYEKFVAYKNAAVIFSKLKLKHGKDITDVFFGCSANELDCESKSKHSKNITEFVKASNDAVKHMHKQSDLESAAGMKLLNETFRCMLHPELYVYGMKVWDHFEGMDEAVKQYINDSIKNNPDSKDELSDDILENTNIRPKVFS